MTSKKEQSTAAKLVRLSSCLLFLLTSIFLLSSAIQLQSASFFKSQQTNRQRPSCFVVDMSSHLAFSWSAEKGSVELKSMQWTATFHRKPFCNEKLNFLKVSKQIDRLHAIFCNLLIIKLLQFTKCTEYRSSIIDLNGHLISNSQMLLVIFYEFYFAYYYVEIDLPKMFASKEVESQRKLIVSFNRKCFKLCWCF